MKLRVLIDKDSRIKRRIDALQERIKNVRRQFWLQFFIACIAAFVLEQVTDHVIESQRNGESELAQSLFDIGGLYQQLVTAGPRKPIVHYTTVVEIDPEQDPIAVGFNNLCKQRAFIAGLVRTVADANPAVIVLDKYFDPQQCSDDEDRKRTDALVAAMADVSLRVPVVVGEDVETRRPDLFAAIHSEAAPNPAMLYSGIVNLDADSRRLALRWVLPREDTELAHRTDNGSTVAFQAAKQFDPRILDKDKRIRKLKDAAVNPYISFLQKDQFPHFYAGEILCKTPTAELQSKCAALPPDLHPDRFRTRDLDHQIVVIGEHTRREDNHSSVIGVVPGFYLQANYTEAILDDRLFRPVNRILDYVFGFLIFAGFELILLENHGKPVRTIVRVLLLLGGAVILLYLAVVHFGYYLNPATVGLLAILINLSHMLFARAERAQEQHT